MMFNKYISVESCENDASRVIAGQVRKLLRCEGSSAGRFTFIERAAAFALHGIYVQVQRLLQCEQARIV